MRDAVPRYTPVAAHLPPVYQEAEESFAEVSGYTGLLDAELRRLAAVLAEVTRWLSPGAVGMWPPATGVDDDADAIVAHHCDVLDELAGWFGYTPPLRWGDDRDLRRDFLLRAARLFRRRGTPRGFVDWFSFYFGITAAGERPLLVEHFKYRPPGAAPIPDDHAHRVTVFVPQAGRFANRLDREAARAFVRRNLPAHLAPRICWVAPGFTFPAPAGPGQAAWNAYVAGLQAHDGASPLVPTNPDPITAVLAGWNAFAATAYDGLCEFVDLVAPEDAVHLRTPPSSGAPTDELGVGRLPNEPGE